MIATRILRCIPISPPGFLPPRLWQGRGKDGRAQLEWVRRGTGLARRAPAQWIVDRAWCVYRCLDLNHVPRSDRYQALALKLAALAPFRRAGHYVAWRGGHALVWFWDEEVREAVAEDCVDQPRRYRCIPESLLQAPPRSVAEGETVRLLRVRSGLDLQVWRDDCLVLSHFFPAHPSQNNGFGCSGGWREYASRRAWLPSLESRWAVPGPFRRRKQRCCDGSVGCRMGS